MSFKGGKLWRPKKKKKIKYGKVRDNQILTMSHMPK